MTSSSAAGDELEKLGNEIIKTGKEIKKTPDVDLSHLSPEEAEKATKVIEGFKYIFEKKNRELWKIWQKIEQAEKEDSS